MPFWETGGCFQLVRPPHRSYFTVAYHYVDLPYCPHAGVQQSGAKTAQLNEMNKALFTDTISALK